MPLHPATEPYAKGHLAMPGVDEIYWELCGNPSGKPAIVLHGGPGSGCDPWYRRLFDPTAYKVLLFDQRGCGRSRPHASDPETSLAENTTQHLIDDIERLRVHLGIERWLMLGGSWGCTLALAYAVQHPARVTELVLFGITTGRKQEFDWTFREGLRTFFPVEWEQRQVALPAEDRLGDVVEAYSRLLQHSNLRVRHDAARAWCLWESATPDWPPVGGLSDRFKDSDLALAFARLVTHYVRHNAWLGDGGALRQVTRIAHIPGVLINGRFDFQAPIANAYELHRAWPRSALVIVDNAGHSASNALITRELVMATERFATKAGGCDDPAGDRALFGL
jgi:proline iminopeptidase